MTLSCLMAGGCAMQEEPCDPLTADAEGTDLYMRLSLRVTSPTRSNPTGGEYGDGQLPGSKAENKIDNITLFFYQSPSGLGDAPDDTEIIRTIYIDHDINQEEDGSWSKTISLGKQKIEEKDNVRVAVCVNTGFPGALANLGQLREYQLTETFKSAALPKDCTGFTMANAFGSDGKLVFKDKNGKDVAGTEDDPYYASLSIERTAARIDILFDSENMTDDADLLTYEVKTGDKTTGDMVNLENVIISNAMSKGSYLLKRVTADTESADDVKFCGDEVINGNYVIEPNTIAKGGWTADGSAPTEEILTDWYGDTRASYIRTNYDDIFGADNSLGRILSYKTDAQNTGAGLAEYAVTLAYVNENTQHQTRHTSDFVTGLVLKALYVPQTVYTDAKAETPKDDYRPGDDFWLYEKKMAEGASRREAIFFADKTAADGYAEAHPEDGAIITPYPDGVCYYNTWIRHCNEVVDGLHVCTPMEYGIVRNNVYRIKFSFSGPGTPQPELDEPENLDVRIFVRKWNIREEQTEIIM